MTKPLVVSIPHQLGREEAMRRLKTGLSRAASSVPVLSVDEERWEDNRMMFRVRALGQAAARPCRCRGRSCAGGSRAAVAVAALCRSGAGRDPESRQAVADQAQLTIYCPAAMRQNTDHGGSAGPASPPQIAVPFTSLCLRAISLPDRLANKQSVAPSPIRQCAVSRPLSAACASPKAAPASRGTISRRRIASSSRTSASRFLPAGFVARFQSSTADRERRWRERIGDLVAIFRIGPGEFACAGPCGRRRRDRRAKSQKNGNGAFEPHSSPMNSIGMAGASSVIAERRLDRPCVGVAFEPVAERAIADLVVVLQEIDEGGRREMAARLAAQLPAAKRGGFALIDEAGASARAMSPRGDRW